MLGIAEYAIYQTFTYQNIFGNYSIIFLWVLIILPLLFIVTTILGRKFYTKISAIVYTISATWLPILVYFFFSSLILTIINSVLPAGIISAHVYSLLVYGFITISISLVLYGIINANRFTITKISIPSNNALSAILKGKKVILVSDAHIGLTNNNGFLKRAVSFINRQNPDMVLFAGDLIDGPKIDFKASLDPLNALQAPLGIYYTPGNHEVYSPDESKLYESIPPNITTLRDGKTSIAGIDIIGLSYDAYESGQATVNKLYRAGYNPQNPTIVLEHEPKNNNHLQDMGVNLIVSGHTHGGQFWPFTWVVKKKFGLYAHGLVIKENTASITTWGIGTWGPSVRIGTHSEIVQITFE